MPLSHLNLGQKFSSALREKVGDPLLYAPSQKLSVIYKGQVCFRWEAGEDFRYFDLASLTKILFSAPLWMRLVQDSSLRLHDRASIYLPWWKGGEDVTIEQLLTHSGGLDWWKPYYKFLGRNLKHEKAWKKLQLLLAKEKPTTKNPSVVYSDLDLFYLGFLAEELFQKSLKELWEDVCEKFGFEDLHFQDGKRSKHGKSLYAPTEFSPWRKRLVQGEVHDENTASLKGIAPHAGLFGGLEELEKYVIGLRALLSGDSVYGLSPQTLKRFVDRKTPKQKGDFGYLFMKPTKGSASCGKYFDDSSFGHTGFTGTSIWFCPKKDIGVIFLTNRVYYGSDLPHFRFYRPLVHDLACQQIL